AEETGATWGVEPNEVVALTPAQREVWLKKWLTSSWDSADRKDPASPTASRPATVAATAAAEDDDGESPETRHEAALARTMLDSDAQLRHGLAFLQARLRPPQATTQPSITAEATKSPVGR